METLPLPHPFKITSLLKKTKKNPTSQSVVRIFDGEEGFVPESKHICLLDGGNEQKCFHERGREGRGIRVGEGGVVAVTPRLSCCCPESKP